MEGPTRRAARVVAITVAALAGCREGPPPSPPSTLEGLELTPVFEVGAGTGEAWESFGGVWDVDVAEDGHLAVLDPEGPFVHVYDEDGAHVGSITTSGLDPGALDDPSGIAWTPAGDLLVWDPGSSWISRFAVDDAGPRFVERWRAFAFGETGFCATDAAAYLSYWQNGRVVHEIGPEGPAHSFGQAPNIPGVETLGPELQEIATEELTPSELLCLSDGILDVSFFGSHVRLSGGDGAVIWERDFDPFNPLSVYTPDGMGLGRRFDQNGGSHLLRSVVPWGEGAALVQHELRTQEFTADGEADVLESRLIRLEDGTEISRTRELPLILATRGNRVFAVLNTPYPHVIAYEISAEA